jgi:hypothetical protein
MECTLNAFEHAFNIQGFKKCDSSRQEPGFEKIAVFADGTEPTHVARLDEDGRWASKLGDRYDIKHNSLGGLISRRYGTAQLYMKRPLQQKAEA